MNVTVFCSFRDVGEPYTSAAKEFARLIATKGHTLVWGGSNSGTMKAIADAAQETGGKIIGISVDYLKHNVRKNADEIVMTPTLVERKAELLSRADAIAVLPGGLGTLDEITEVMEFKKQELHDKPVVFLSTSGFYDGFKMQLERMDREGFLPKSLSEYVFFAATPKDAVQYIESNH